MSKKLGILVISLILVVSLSLSFGTGCNLATETSPSPEEGLAAIEQAWGIIFQDYVDKDNLDVDQLSQAAIKGMVEALDDPYTSYLDAEAYQLSLSDLKGKFEGIGAYVAVGEEQIVITAPIADSPAAKAGIEAGDVVLEIDGKSTSDMSLAEAVLSIRGPKGTAVKLLVLHQGETEPEEIEVVRAEIELPSVSFEMKEDIAYINISYFSERTDEELSPLLPTIVQEAATGIILDLRGNLGGVLQAVVDVASHFLEEGVVVTIVDSEGGQTALEVKANKVTTDLPLVVLVDGYSASGSEILAGALQDHVRATIAGTTTYGKGGVNILRQLEDGAGLYITTAYWLTPDGYLIEGKGITPDYEIEAEDAIEWAIDYLRAINDAK